MVDRTTEELQETLNKERAWRRIEIGVVLTHALRNDIGKSQPMCRAFWLLQYAHWEGFVKIAVEKYLLYVAMRNLKYSDLKQGFKLHSATPFQTAVQQFYTGSSDKFEAMEMIFSVGEQKFTKRHIEVNTQSNLRFNVLEHLSQISCVDLHTFVDEKSLDTILADRRNEIAHGNWLKIDQNEAREMRDKCARWMDQIHDNIVNAAVLKSYREENN